MVIQIMVSYLYHIYIILMLIFLLIGCARGKLVGKFILTVVYFVDLF